ncbi:thioredoxin-disulfide reductase [bacterium]|nr:thioredoxin-disulfide reductase [bacterium]
MENKEELEFDTVILGAGPAGFSAALYAARGNLKTAIIDINMFGGQPSNYLEIENYPGFSKIGGCDLMEKFEEHADNFNVEKFPMVEIIKADLTSVPKIIETTDTIFKAKSVIIATGASPKKLGIKGEDEYKCRGVSYCAVCDGAFYKDRTVAVVGGGNAAVEEGMYLTKFAKKVYIIHRRDELRADKIVQQRAFANEKIEFVLSAIPLEIKGEDTVKTLVIKDLKTNEEKNIQTDGVFPYIGFTPNVDLFGNQLKLNQQGFIETDVNMQTSIEGVFAAGDVRNTPLRQVITAAADGAIAACSAVKYVDSLNPAFVK